MGKASRTLGARATKEASCEESEWKSLFYSGKDEASLCFYPFLLSWYSDLNVTLNIKTMDKISFQVKNRCPSL